MIIIILVFKGRFEVIYSIALIFLIWIIMKKKTQTKQLLVVNTESNSSNNRRPSPLVDELSHFLLHLFAFQLLLQKHFEAGNRGRPLRVLLVGL